jgi:hypothetical protein
MREATCGQKNRYTKTTHLSLHPGFSGNTGSNLTQQSAIQSPIIAICVALDLLRFKGFG